MNVISLDQAPALGHSWPAARDAWRLAKPRLSLLVFCTTGIGLWTAPGRLGFGPGLCTLLATGLLVAAANAYNSYLERDVDARMRRTAKRPLPQGLVEPGWALRASLLAALLAMVALYAAAGPLPALLGFVAFASYAWLYTPMKQVSAAAVFVGAVPGALPPLLGAAAADGHLSAGGGALFALLFVWQLPHFFAIALKLADDYAKGGIVVVPHVLSAHATRCWLFALSLLLVPVSMLPTLAGIASLPMAAVAGGSSLCFAGLCAFGLQRTNGPRWATRVFVASVLHMSLLLLALFVDGARPLWRERAKGPAAAAHRLLPQGPPPVGGRG